MHGLAVRCSTTAQAMLPVVATRRGSSNTWFLQHACRIQSLLCSGVHYTQDGVHQGGPGQTYVDGLTGPYALTLEVCAARETCWWKLLTYSVDLLRIHGV